MIPGASFLNSNVFATSLSHFISSNNLLFYSGQLEQVGGFCFCDVSRSRVVVAPSRNHWHGEHHCRSRVAGSQCTALFILTPHPPLFFLLFYSQSVHCFSPSCFLSPPDSSVPGAGAHQGSRGRHRRHRALIGPRADCFRFVTAPVRAVGLTGRPLFFIVCVIVANHPMICCILQIKP